MKKTFWAVLAIAIVSFMSMGCFTTMLWEKKAPESTLSRYKESIESFMMTQDGSKIIFASDNYHYILNSDPSLSFLLKHKDEIPVAYEFAKGSYTITTNHVTSNYAQAIFYADIDLNKCDSAVVSEMINSHYGTLDKERNKLTFTFTLGGTRYRSDSKINDKLIKLANPISLNIQEYQATSSVGETIKKITLTPLTIAADGAVTAVFVGLTFVLVPVVIPVAIMSHK